MFTSQLNGLSAIDATLSSCQLSSEGGISEVWYDHHRPNLLTLLLLPALQQLGRQSRWLLWLTPQLKLNKHWLENAGIPLHKSIELPHLSQKKSVQVIIQALQSNNYSAVTAWFDEQLSESDYWALDNAAKNAGTLVLILRKKETDARGYHHKKVLEVHSAALH